MAREVLQLPVELPKGIGLDDAADQVTAELGRDVVFFPNPEGKMIMKVGVGQTEQRQRIENDALQALRAVFVLNEQRAAS